MKERLRQFMMGRYGNDDLNRFLSVASLLALLISTFTGWTALYSIALVLLVFSFIRMFSRNTAKRSQENFAFLRFRGNISGWFSGKKQRFDQRKTHCYYKCPSCQKQLRVPKGRGRISITCPQCRTEFEKKT